MQKVVRPDLTSEEFKLFRDLIRERCGIDLSKSQIDSLRISLLARTSEKHSLDYISYYEFLKSHPGGKEEFKELINLITINETSFFRQQQHFEILRNYIIPEIVRTKKEKKLNIWSAGCSTGEEPYSIAITIKEYFPGLSKWQVRILATDVSKKALSAAKEAEYGTHTLRLVERRILDKYFEHINNESYQLKKEIRDMVCFGYHNLIKEPYPILIMSDWDIIFCRNVTIYFNIESTKRVLDNFYNSLGDNGYLFIGYAEMIQHVTKKFKVTKRDGVFFYRKSQQKESETHYAAMTVAPSLTKRLKDFLPHSPLKIEQSDDEILRRATSLFKEEEYTLARTEAEKLIARNPANIAARLLKVQIYANDKEYAKAEEECLLAIKINQMNESAHYLLGIIYEGQNRLERAIDEYRKTIYIDKDFVLAYFNLANIYRKQGRIKEASREFRNATIAAERAPKGEWTKFTGGFHTGAIVEAAEKIVSRLKE